LEEVIEIASWNVNSIRARIEHVKTWLETKRPDVLLLQELKGTEFPSPSFKQLGYDSASVTQKTYNGVAILSRSPIEIANTTLLGDQASGGRAASSLSGTTFGKHLNISAASALITSCSLLA
jgi:exonuclease III